MIMQKILRIDSNDNLIVALKDLHWRIVLVG